MGKINTCKLMSAEKTDHYDRGNNTAWVRGSIPIRALQVTNVCTHIMAALEHGPNGLCSNENHRIGWMLSWPLSTIRSKIHSARSARVSIRRD